MNTEPARQAKFAASKPDERISITIRQATPEPAPQQAKAKALQQYLQ